MIFSNQRAAGTRTLLVILWNKKRAEVRQCKGTLVMFEEVRPGAGDMN